MRYSLRLKQVLRAIQLDAESSEQQIARRLRLRPHIVRYEKQRALADKIIRPIAVIDFFRLGLQQFQCYLSFAYSGPTTRQKVMRTLEGSSRVAWYAELGGRLQLGLSICARNGSELHKILDAFIQVSGVRILQRTIGVVTRFEYFPKKYLAPQYKDNAANIFDAADAPIERDALDSKILSLLIEDGAAPIKRLAERASIPRATFAARISKMRDSGLLRAPGYLISAQALGMSTFKILLYLSHDNQKILEIVSAFSRESIAIVNLIRCHAAWEYELTAEVEQPGEIPGLVYQINQRLKEWLRDIEIIPVFAQARPTLFLKNYINSK